MTFKSELVFARILAPLIAGICLAYQYPSTYLLAFCLPTTIFIFVGIIIIKLLYTKLDFYRYKAFVGLVVSIFWFAFGAANCLIHSSQLTKNYFAKIPSKLLVAWISNEPEFKNGFWHGELTVIGCYKGGRLKTACGQISFILKPDSIRPIFLTYGNKIILPSSYTSIAPTYNPGEFDYKGWLSAKDIHHQVFLNQNEVLLSASNMGSSLIAYAINVRKRQVDIYRKLILDDEAFAVASTLVLGYRANLSKETLASYSKTGTIHALSVSGMHVGIIYLFLNWALFFLDRNRFLKILKLLLICSLIWYYALLTGFSPSVLRSAIMLSVYILAKAFHKNSNSYNILAFTAFCLLCYQPFLIWDVGFQLSFLAVFGLMYLQPKIYNWFYIKNKWLDKLWATVALSLAAQLTTLTVSIYYFHQFPLYFIFSNLFIIVPLTLMMYLGIAILLLKIYFIAPIFEWIIIFTNKGLQWIASLPYAGITSIWISHWQLCLSSLALALFIVAFVKPNKKMLYLSIMLFTIFQFTIVWGKIKTFTQQKILFYSLKKNYAAAFIDGRHAILLTDLSLTDKNYDFSIKPALEQLRISKITFVKWENDTAIGSFRKEKYQVVFKHYRILMVDQHVNDQHMVGMPNFDAVWIHQQPNKSMISLRKEVLFTKLFIDGSNNDYRIKKYQKEAEKLAMEFHTLKKNNSYLIELKN